MNTVRSPFFNAISKEKRKEICSDIPIHERTWRNWAAGGGVPSTEYTQAMLPYFSVQERLSFLREYSASPTFKGYPSIGMSISQKQFSPEFLDSLSLLYYTHPCTLSSIFSLVSSTLSETFSPVSLGIEHALYILYICDFGIFLKREQASGMFPLFLGKKSLAGEALLRKKSQIARGQENSTIAIPLFYKGDMAGVYLLRIELSNFLLPAHMRLVERYVRCFYPAIPEYFWLSQESVYELKDLQEADHREATKNLLSLIIQEKVPSLYHSLFYGWKGAASNSHPIEETEEALSLS